MQQSFRTNIEEHQRIENKRDCIPQEKVQIYFFENNLQRIHKHLILIQDQKVGQHDLLLHQNHTLKGNEVAVHILGLND